MSNVVREMTTEETVEGVCRFKLAGLQLEAVRVYRDDELCVRGKEAIRRADGEDGRVIRSEKNWERIYEARNGIPPELNGNWLTTARPNPDYPRSVSGLVRIGGAWCEAWNHLDGGWDGNDLVLRRRK